MNESIRQFSDLIGSFAKGATEFSRQLAQYFEVPNTTNERQDVGGCFSNVIPPHLKHLIDAKEWREVGDGWVAIGSSNYQYIHYSDGTECLVNRRTNKILFGSRYEFKYAPESFIDWWELDIKPQEVEEVYYHGATMCVVVKLKNGNKIGIRSVTIGRKPMLFPDGTFR